ncbi:MAG: protein kinase, partial [Ignavibacteriales bacterium]|nr:protein kinase [Ignavibacteriales bacterium]
GGGGVVYKAQDTTLDRFVALKFLPPHLSANEEDKSRFIQEAKAAAALNHPNICTIYGIEESGDSTFIAMEYVEGQTLHDKGLNLPLKQSIEIGIQLADGLAAAHEKGIVHRDIKSENIMLQKDGRVRIMDFGLARIKSASRLTKVGSTVGTTGYMSPEQVQGMESDHRSDIFSLGVILYELFAGQSPFKGAHETAINYEIVNVDPEPISAVKPDFDAQLDAIVMECLAKDPAERSQSAAEVAKDLRHAKRESSRSRMSRITPARTVSTQRLGSSPVIPVQHAGFPFRQFLPWALTGVALLSVLILLLLGQGDSANVPFTVRAVIPPPEETNFHPYGFAAGPVVVSPNGRAIAFVAVTPDGRTMLYLRELDAVRPRPLAGTERAWYPFWSPDSRWVGFFSGGKLRKVDVSGSPPVTVCDAPNSRGGTWSKDGTILFTPEAVGPIFSVAAAGGTPVVVSRIDTTRKESTHRWPSFLPDGKHFLYFSRTASFGSEAEGDALFAASLDFTTNKMLMNTSANVIYASGHLLFMRGGTLLAQQFDESALELKGDPITVAENVINDPGFNLAVFSASENGILAYQTGVGLAGARMMIVDRTGKELGFVGDVIEHFITRISPDGRKVIASVFEPRSRTQNLWVYDLARNARTRFTTGLATDFNPVWSPDGMRIAFYSNKDGMYRIYTRPADGVGIEETLVTSTKRIAPTDWSRDGRHIVYQQFNPVQSDIWVVPRSGEKKPLPFLQTQFEEFDARFSPDGRWIAYASNETGINEVYIRPFPGPGTSAKVSAAGGASPVWQRDGSELFYIDRENKLMSAEMRIRGAGIEIGTIRALFTRTPVMSDYEPFPDGKRFLMNRNIEPKKTDPITIVVNWDAGLKKR